MEGRNDDYGTMDYNGRAHTEQGRKEGLWDSRTTMDEHTGRKVWDYEDYNGRAHTGRMDVLWDYGTTMDEHTQGRKDMMHGTMGLQWIYTLEGSTLKDYGTMGLQ